MSHCARHRPQEVGKKKPPSRRLLCFLAQRVARSRAFSRVVPKLLGRSHYLLDNWRREGDSNPRSAV